MLKTKKGQLSMELAIVICAAIVVGAVVGYSSLSFVKDTGNSIGEASKCFNDPLSNLKNNEGTESSSPILTVTNDTGRGQYAHDRSKYPPAFGRNLSFKECPLTKKSNGNYLFRLRNGSSNKWDYRINPATNELCIKNGDSFVKKLPIGDSLTLKLNSGSITADIDDKNGKYHSITPAPKSNKRTNIIDTTSSKPFEVIISKTEDGYSISTNMESDTTDFPYYI
ncbi:class III signal peptide-containing protein [Methanococcus voltae]|uniref:Uncharacterized protein n=1 Tax=Methanococcus voltae PS TaxID=523842 RepID=A0ABT2EW61_METVO|nr:class III signal peptide-containing protein [Methanococcus voltae]MBP2172691.1 hypothetical protein [Methanococcus voltae]MCS3922187.1 hypothetical protein [Methanococcus voltae PS]